MRRAGIVLASLLAAPGTVLAEPSLAVLGVTSTDAADEEIAGTFTAMLRRAAQESTSVRYLPREVALAQMVLAFGCDDPPDASCLAQVGQQMQSERLVYGYMRRAGDRVEVDLHYFDVAGQRELGRVDGSIPLVQSDVDALRAPARRLLGQLLGERQTGRLEIDANVPGAIVTMDGEERGPAPLSLPEAPAGPHRIEVRKPGHRTHVETVEIVPGESVRVEATLEPTESGALGGGPVEDEGPTTPPDDEASRRPSYLGWGLLGGGIVLAAVGVYFSAVTAGHNGDSGEFHDLRVKYGESPDVCSEPTLTPDESDLCDTASLQSTLQFVFYGAAAIAGGVGLFLVVGGSKGEASADASVRLDPFLGTESGGLVLSGVLP